MIIICDVDNILNNLMEKTLKLYNARMDKNIQMSDIVAYSFAECLSIEDADAITELFKEKELWDSLTPLPASQKGLRRLVNQGHRVYLATATHPINFPWKVEWITKYFPYIPMENIMRVTDKSLLKADILIDDCLDHLTANICERVCLDYPWNRSESKDYAYDIKRAHTWNDIVNIINDIERKDKAWDKE